MFENDQTFFPGGEKSGKIWPGHKWHGCDHHPGELQLVVLSFPCSRCSKERTIFVVQYCCCWILLLLFCHYQVQKRQGYLFLCYLILSQVHNREGYLRQLVNSLSAARHIENTLLVFSHDVWDEQINTLVRYESSKHLGSCWICNGFDVSGLSATSGSELDWSWSHNCLGDQAHIGVFDDYAGCGSGRADFRGIEFTMVVQMFYPFSLQTHPHSFPGKAL